jgi:putative hydrolase of the HAD superfamily
MERYPGAHPPFEGVLLDLFGTLIPAGPRGRRAPHLYAMARVLEADPDLFEEQWVKSFGDRVTGRLGDLGETIRHIARLQGVAPSSERVHQAAEIRLDFTRSLLESCAPVLPALDALRSAGFRLAVVSDTSEEPPRLWPSTALGRRIETTVFSCQEGFCKPDPRIYRLALERLGLPAARCVFVGDGGSRELSGAESVGIPAFLYRFPEETAGPDARYDPDRAWRGTVLRDLRELISVDR